MDCSSKPACDYAVANVLAKVNKPVFDGAEERNTLEHKESTP